jgi:hypothetical protein
MPNRERERDRPPARSRAVAADRAAAEREAARRAAAAERAAAIARVEAEREYEYDDFPPEPGLAVPPEAGLAVRSGLAALGAAQAPARRSVTISGRPAERYIVPSASRRTQRRPHERPGFQPDRVAMWAVLLGVVLILVAATSSHAAVLHAHAFLAK